MPVGSLSPEDEQPTWRALEVRPGSTEFISGELCLSIRRVDANAPPPPAAAAPKAAAAIKRQRSSSSVGDRQAFGSTPYSKPFVISPSEIDFSEGDEPLGQGGFGTVRLGHFRGLPVAVKTLLLRCGVKKAALVEEFRSEVAMLAKVSRRGSELVPTSHLIQLRFMVVRADAGHAELS